MISSKEIRQQFIDFFLERGHSLVPSSPVIPIDDNTLLFTNAGMNQFKGIFLGHKQAEIPRAVNSQKCIRAGGKHNDLEEVGKDGYHHTFFEMLGNWSFGDYYKKEAISWAWELLTEVWKLPKDRLHATVHDSDTEAFDLWKELTDIDPSHITYHGDKDNFWEMGESGPCGPCSEIHLDRGLCFCDKQNDPTHDCKVNGDCHRYIELWNLVFIQYFRDETGLLLPLPNRFVDTGAGLERICQVIQGKNSNYDTDLFEPILHKIAKLSGVPYTETDGVSHRVIADHIRTLCFALADGGFPSNEGRGYVIRRILRRAARNGRLLGFRDPFLWNLVDTIIEVMGHHYVELNGKSAYIKMVIKAEEERFNQTLDKGLEIFEQMVSQLKDNALPGTDAFMLYDTYGFPLDLTQIMASERGIEVDLTGFHKEMEKQRERARSASKFAIDLTEEDWIDFEPSTPTEFIGYDHDSAICKIQRYSLCADGTIKVQLDKTPFYAESGGQVADTGTLKADGLEIEITHVKKIEDNFIHIGNLISGVIEASSITAQIDVSRRADIARNHTATHLLHQALRSVLGDHIQQKGSLVTPDYLRFDFTHIQGMDKLQMRAVETLVNEQIRINRSVQTKLMPVSTAREEGAIALFGEKYGDNVRVVGVEGFSKELCGGTHVSATGSIGFFKILSESSSAAGIRRIEAITGRAAEHWISSMEDRIQEIAHKLSCPEAQLMSRLDAMIGNIHSLEQELSDQKMKELSGSMEKILSLAEEHNGIMILNQVLDLPDVNALRAVGDMIKTRQNNMIAFIFCLIEEKVSILCVVTPDLVNRFHAGKLVGKIAALLDGKGGGRPDSAMAGGKNISALPEAQAQVYNIIFG